MNKIRRREFLKKAGILLGSGLTAPLKSFSEPNFDDPSRVVVVTDEACTTGSIIHSEIVQLMVDAGIRSYAGISSVGEAWRSLFPGLTSYSVIGIKVNCINSYVASNPETTQAIINGLLQMPVSGGINPNNIIIWDRTNWELQSAGYILNTGSNGVRCFGTDQSGVGYSNEVQLNVNGIISHPSRILTEQIDYLINLGVIKDHSASGATFCMKNHYGSIDNPDALHNNNCDPYIPSLNQQLISVVGNKQKFCMVDAIFGIYSGGPGGPPDFVYNGIIMGEDMVAVDRIGLDILVENGMNHAWQASYIETASLPPYNLGNYNSELIERINIQNPSGVIHHHRFGDLGDFRLAGNFPNPFNQSTEIRFTVIRPAEVIIKIMNIEGGLVKDLADGYFEIGDYSLRWDGKDAWGFQVPSGIYFCRMLAGEFKQTLKMTLVR